MVRKQNIIRGGGEIKNKDGPVKLIIFSSSIISWLPERDQLWPYSSGETKSEKDI